MDKTEFLKKNIFQNLKNRNKETGADAVHYFSEADFEIVLERIAELGIGIYTIEPRLKGKTIDAKLNEDYRKKATDPKWYKRAFFELKKEYPNMEYSATYRVSDRLLNRKSTVIDTSDKK